MHAGTQQDQRTPEALRPGYFAPDEMSLAERIRLSFAQASRLSFLSEDGVEAGSWGDALRRDETVVLADIAAFPLAKADQEFLQLVPWDDEDTLWLRVWHMVQRYNRWCQSLLESENSKLRCLGETMLAQIRRGLAEMLAPALASWRADAASLHLAWRAAPESDAARVSPEDRRQLLRRSWMALHQAVDRIQPLARDALGESMRSGTHEPAMGLLLATLQLFQYSRAPLNRIPERLTEFYYHDVLQLRPRRPTIERVHLLFERDPRFPAPVRIEAGANFVGGKDAAGQAIAFAADQALEISDVRVGALHSLRQERDDLISPEREFAYVKGIKWQSIPLQSPDAAYQPFPAWWPLLGGQGRGAGAQALDATLGIAVTSPLLVMREGVREIRLRLQLSHPADDDDSLRALLQKHGGQRTAAWLGQVFERYAEYENRTFPRRPRAGREPEPEDVGQLASDAWHRSAQFSADVHLCFLLARCQASLDPVLFRERLGRLFSAWLVAADEELREGDLDALRMHASRLGVSGDQEVDIDDPLILIHSPRRRVDNGAAKPSIERALMFERVFAGVWLARVSTDQGWLALGKVFTHRSSGERAGRFGAIITIAMCIGADLPPVVPCRTARHGAQWPATAALQLGLQTQTRMYAYSLLRQWTLRDFRLDVSVAGLRDVVLYNQLGRLDPSKPFLPFGPAPGRSAYLIFGSPELSSKPLQEMRLRIKWSGLPALPGGFAEHYAGYPGYQGMQSFAVQGKVLMDGRWQLGAGQFLPLFQTVSQSRAIRDDIVLEFPSADLRRWHRATPTSTSSPESAYQYGLHSRNGFFRLDLAESSMAFGHADYPGLLTAVLTHNARSKKLPRVLPREPYTPAMEQLSVDYRASQILPLRRGAREGAEALSGVFHLHAGGLQAIELTQASRYPSLLPGFAHDGNLYIGLEGANPQGGLSLFFHLRQEEAAERWLDAPPRLEWAVWGNKAWQPLAPAQILADSTRGMLRSGIVHLSLPAGMEPGCPQWPGRFYWLRLSADWGFDLLAGLYGVHAQALCASRVEPAGHAEPLAPLPPGTIRQALPSVAGLRTLTQVGASFGRLLDDPAAGQLTRSAERLRHKQRAVGLWDYERLLLEAFPDVYKAKCLAHQLPTGDVGDDGKMVCQQRPGHVLVVVVPAHSHGCLFNSTEAPRIDAARLDEMTAYLSARSPGGVRLVVRNASYERIQVRCRVKLSADAHPGVVLRQINTMLVEYLSPWHPVGYTAQFDWQVEAEPLEAYIRSLPQVVAVGQFSLLHIVCGDNRFSVLRDTARQTERGYGLRKVTPVQPWSLALPVAQNLIELSGPALDPSPRVTGLSRLEVGNTFIVGGRSRNESGEGRED